jgi:capsular exopolysaccharide synthesis family protein
VSRVDEALRRLGGPGAANGPATDGQHLFDGGWAAGPAAPEQPDSKVSVADDEAVHHSDVGEAVRHSGSYRGLLTFSSQWKERLAAGPHGNTTLIEQFRRLAATMHQAHQAGGLRSVMVTSASPGDGKTLTALNLALVLSESYRYNVLLIDADFRRPSIASVVDLADGSGLTEALRAPREQKLALVNITSRLTLLPAGQPIANSIEALTSPRMRKILDEAAARFDWVLLDAPPVGAATDARLLTHMVGGTLFVIHAGKTPFLDVQKAIEAIGREQILGVVLNATDRPANESDYYYGAGAEAGGD